MMMMMMRPALMMAERLKRREPFRKVIFLTRLSLHCIFNKIFPPSEREHLTRAWLLLFHGGKIVGPFKGELSREKDMSWRGGGLGHNDRSGSPTANGRWSLLVIALDALCLLFWISINTTAHNLGRFETSFPYTKLKNKYWPVTPKPLTKKVSQLSVWVIPASFTDKEVF